LQWKRCSGMAPPSSSAPCNCYLGWRTPCRRCGAMPWRRSSALGGGAARRRGRRWRPWRGDRGGP
jgi:hypothetical protein